MIKYEKINTISAIFTILSDSLFESTNSLINAACACAYSVPYSCPVIGVSVASSSSSTS